MKRLRLELFILFGFAILPILLFADVTLGGQTMVPADNLFQWEPWASQAEAFNVGRPQNPLLSDLVIQNYVWKQFTRQTIESGDIPLWNPYAFAGAPFLAAGQHSMYYPFSWLFLLMPISAAYGWFTVSQLWLAGFLAYLFGRVLGMKRPSAIVLGVIYQGCGFMVVSAAVFPMIIAAAAWLPLLLACIYKLVHSQTYRVGWMVLGAVALGLQILAGHVEITYYTLLLMALYALWLLILRGVAWRNWRGSLAPAGWLAGMVAMGLLLGGIQLLPLFEVGQGNFREGSAAFEDVLTWAFPERRVLTFALPNFFGNPSHHTYVDALTGETVELTGTTEWGLKNYVEGGIYLGILPLLLAFLGLWGQRKRLEIWFWLGLSGFSLAFIFGTPLYAILYYGLPFINQLHTPFRWVFPLSLCVAVLAGWGVEYLSQTRKWQTKVEWADFLEEVLPQRSRRAKREELSQMVWASDSRVRWWQRPFTLWTTPSLITLMAGLTFWAGLLLIVGLYGSRLVYPQIEPFIEQVFRGLALADTAFPSAQAFYSYQFRQLFFLALILVASGATLRVSRCPIFLRNGRPVWELMALVVIGLDVLIANFGFHTAVDPALLQFKPQMVQFLEAQEGDWRITSFAPKGNKPFNANAGWLFNIPDVRGYDSIIPKQYTDYMGAIEQQNELKFNRVQPIVNVESLNSPLLDVLGVRFVISQEPIPLPKFVQVWQGEGVRIYENLAVAPRAYSLPTISTWGTNDPLADMQTYDPRQYVVTDAPNVGRDTPVASTMTPQTVRYEGTRTVRVTAVIADSEWLILNDSYADGWRAYVRPQGASDDAEVAVPIYRVNGNFRGVMLEPGTWEVRFQYSPLTFQLGGLLSAMGTIILALTVGVWGWGQWQNRSSEESSITHSLFRNSAAPMALNLLNKGIDFVFAAFYLRVLGSADSGSYATAIAAAGWFDIISNFGLNILIIREGSQNKENVGNLLWQTSILRLGTAVLALLPVLIYIGVTTMGGRPLSPDEITATVLIIVGMLFSGLSQGVTGVFYIFERADLPAVMTTVTTILKVAMGVTVLLLGWSFVGLAGVSIVTNIITLSILGLLAFRQFPLNTNWQIQWDRQWQLLKLGYPLMLIHLLQTAFIYIDVFLLRPINGPEVVGWYNSAYKWFNALQIIPSFFTLALFPIISSAIQENMAKAQRMYSLSLKIMLLLALPIAAGIWFLAYQLVGLLGGAEFLPHGAIALQIVIWSIPLGWLNSVTNYVLIGLGLERLQPRAFTIAVLFNVITNALFLPRFSYVAAGVTTVLSELVLLVLFHYFLRQRMPNFSWPALLTKPLIVTAVMVAVMWLGGQVHWLLGVVLGTAVYGAGLLLWGIIGAEEWAILEKILPAGVLARVRGVVG